MTYYAIKRKKDGKFLAGSDYRYFPPHTRFANEYMPVKLFAEIDLDIELKKRRINLQRYQVVKVEVKEEEENG